MKQFLVGCAVLGLLLCGMTTFTVAEPNNDSFSGMFDSQNNLVAGDGTGWENGLWVHYPNSLWWNQWFYDDPPDPLRWKWIEYDITVEPVPVQGTLPTPVEIVINWSTLEWPESGPTGAPPLDGEEMFIVRDAIVFQGQIDPTAGPLHFKDRIVIPDFNPEWVSIDFRVIDPISDGVNVLITGDIIHECVPEPCSALLLGFGAIGLVACIRRRRL